MVQKVKIVDFRFSWTTLWIPDPDPAKWCGSETLLKSDDGDESNKDKVKLFLKQLDIIISILFWIDLDSVSDPDPQGSASFGHLRIRDPHRGSRKPNINNFHFLDIKHDSK